MKKHPLCAVLGFWLVFEAVAVSLWLALDDLFFLFNFSYIGTCLALGLFFYQRGWRYARQAVQLFVGLYMLVYLGVLCRENMQLEGFWFYLFSGVFEAAVIQYAVAKLFGPLLFGRGWCGYACWTAMVLDFLPYKTRQAPRKNWGFARVLVFAASLCYVALLFVLHIPGKAEIMFYSFLAGNALYYAAGITLAFVCKDNRAFCKYLCPITIFLKPASKFALLRVRVDPDKCVGCGRCKAVCPMDVDMTDNARSRQNGTECILCMNCIKACPAKALDL